MKKNLLKLILAGIFAFNLFARENEYVDLTTQFLIPHEIFVGDTGVVKVPFTPDFDINIDESAVIDVLNKFNTYKNDTCSDLINHLLNRMEETDFITKYKELQQERIEKEQEINILIKY